MSLQVSGLACPWNVYNAYNELMKPGAFSDFLARRNGKPLPMGFMHIGQCGEWTKLEETERGLECHGVVTSPLVINAIERRLMGELSISFNALTAGDPTETVARLNSRPPSQRAMFQRRLKIEPAHDYRKVDLAEISLVDDGAFAGTFFKVDE